MKCKVTASLLFYNKRTYSKGEYVEVADSKVDMFIREHLAMPCPVKPKPEIVDTPELMETPEIDVPQKVVTSNSKHENMRSIKKSNG